ncbi:hypothetical protein DM01DRAFT_327641 [Hesseltinella vesiculosa]|uniref:Uncharacterized protein n=1 Tax=Hesseltinella vesiculosa TaxID=101127 RepID=A0A1X2GL88_9FUNG|nr:hypothetical protein DM01DRAFT_327641 [Hesseltinella vesiculosa]
MSNNSILPSRGSYRDVLLCDDDSQGSGSNRASPTFVGTRDELKVYVKDLAQSRGCDRGHLLYHWRITVNNPAHNHTIIKDSAAHPLSRCLTVAQQEVVRSTSTSMIRPPDIWKS